jgi:diguanylate cyclase (GGDEF)-like protein
MSVTLFSPLPVPRRASYRLLSWSWLSWTTVLAASFSAALVGIQTWQMWQVHDTSLRHAKVVTASLAQSVSQQVETTLKTAETVVATVVQRVEADGTGAESRQRLYGLMTSLAAALPAIHEMGILDKDGNAIVKSQVLHPVGMNYRERDYFRFLSTNGDDKPFVGIPVKSKLDGSVNITVSRRINNTDGSFGGVVVTSVSMGFFEKLFESIQSKSSGLISLVADNGVLLARSPELRGAGASSLGKADAELEALLGSPPDSLDYVSPNDGVHRVGSYRRLDQYPMVAQVAQDSREILREWRNQVRVHAAVVLCALIAIASLGYRVEQANRVTRLQALRDNLTGLPNRRCLNEAIDTEFRRAARNGTPLSYIMADLDFFKKFNDRYGHLEGDACLRDAAHAVQGVLRRAGDMAARYGGEEIAVLLPGMDVAGAIKVAEEAQKAVASLKMEHADSPYGIVTLSAGVASCRPGIHGPAWKSLIKAADGALYAAKAMGRNAIAVSQDAAAVEGEQA